MVRIRVRGRGWRCHGSTIGVYRDGCRGVVSRRGHSCAYLLGKVHVPHLCLEHHDVHHEEEIARVHTRSRMCPEAKF